MQQPRQGGDQRVEGLQIATGKPQTMVVSVLRSTGGVERNAFDR
jgi:hypothetical protein